MRLYMRLYKGYIRVMQGIRIRGPFQGSLLLSLNIYACRFNGGAAASAAHQSSSSRLWPHCDGAIAKVGT